MGSIYQDMPLHEPDATQLTVTFWPYRIIHSEVVWRTVGHEPPSGFRWLDYCAYFPVLGFIHFFYPTQTESHWIYEYDLDY